MGDIWKIKAVKDAAVNGSIGRSMLFVGWEPMTSYQLVPNALL